jgi:hypothetical protein
MKAGVTFFLAFSFGFATACWAAEKDKNTRIDELTSIQLGSSSLKFEGEAPKKTVAPDDPAGMNNFKKESTRPFLGLRFSTPLKDDFFKSGR